MFIKSDQTLIAPPSPVSAMTTETCYIIVGPHGLVACN